MGTPLFIGNEIAIGQVDKQALAMIWYFCINKCHGGIEGLISLSNAICEFVLGSLCYFSSIEYLCQTETTYPHYSYDQSTSQECCCATAAYPPRF